jgi:hypothetical protein
MTTTGCLVDRERDGGTPLEAHSAEPRLYVISLRSARWKIAESNAFIDDPTNIALRAWLAAVISDELIETVKLMLSARCENNLVMLHQRPGFGVKRTR